MAGLRGIKGKTTYLSGLLSSRGAGLFFDLLQFWTVKSVVMSGDVSPEGKMTTPLRRIELEWLVQLTKIGTRCTTDTNVTCTILLACGFSSANFYFPSITSLLYDSYPPERVKASICLCSIHVKPANHIISTCCSSCTTL